MEYSIPDHSTKLRAALITWAVCTAAATLLSALGASRLAQIAVLSVATPALLIYLVRTLRRPEIEGSVKRLREEERDLRESIARGREILRLIEDEVTGQSDVLYDYLPELERRRAQRTHELAVLTADSMKLVLTQWQLDILRLRTNSEMRRAVRDARGEVEDGREAWDLLEKLLMKWRSDYQLLLRFIHIDHDALERRSNEEKAGKDLA